MLQTEQLLFGLSSSIETSLQVAERYARSSYPLLIVGERGTGKTVLARHLHTLSERSGAFVKTSVAALAENLEISQLAGHRRGAFTGAVSDAKGLIESAQHGTFFSG